MMSEPGYSVCPRTNASVCKCASICVRASVHVIKSLQDARRSMSICEYFAVLVHQMLWVSSCTVRRTWRLSQRTTTRSTPTPLVPSSRVLFVLIHTTRDIMLDHKNPSHTLAHDQGSFFRAQEQQLHKALEVWCAREHVCWGP